MLIMLLIIIFYGLGAIATLFLIIGLIKHRNGKEYGGWYAATFTFTCVQIALYQNFFDDISLRNIW